MSAWGVQKAVAAEKKARKKAIKRKQPDTDIPEGSDNDDDGQSSEDEGAGILGFDDVEVSDHNSSGESDWAMAQQRVHESNPGEGGNLAGRSTRRGDY